MAADEECLYWSDPDLWDEITLNWDDVCLLDDTIRKAQYLGTDTLPQDDEWIRRKKRRIIELICVIDNKSYKEVKEKLEGGNITVDYIKLIRDKLVRRLNISVDDINITYTDRK